MTDIDGATEHASSITIGTTSFGICNESGQQCSCDYVTCSSLAQNKITTTSSALQVQIKFTSDVSGTLCKSCRVNGNKVNAAARISLTLGK